MMATKRQSDIGLVTLDAAAERFGVKREKLLRIMEDAEWLVLGDTSHDVCPEQFACGHLEKNKHGEMCFTVKGLAAIRLEIPATSKKRASRDEVEPEPSGSNETFVAHNSEDVPF